MIIHPPRSIRERVDIRPTARVLGEHVERHGVELTCERFGLCRRRVGAIVARRTTRGQHAHFLDRASVEDILTHGPEAFGTLHVALVGPLQARIHELVERRGPERTAHELGIDLPRGASFVLQLAEGRAGNGAPVTHVCAGLAARAGIDPLVVDDLPVLRAWCPACEDPVLVADDGCCPWCDAPSVPLAAGSPATVAPATVARAA